MGSWEKKFHSDCTVQLIFKFDFWSKVTSKYSTLELQTSVKSGTHRSNCLKLKLKTRETIDGEKIYSALIEDRTWLKSLTYTMALSRPPDTCLQYWTTLTGRITTFNFLATTSSSHLRNQEWVDSKVNWIRLGTQEKWPHTGCTIGALMTSRLSQNFQASQAVNGADDITTPLFWSRSNLWAICGRQFDTLIYKRGLECPNLFNKLWLTLTFVLIGKNFLRKNQGCGVCLSYLTYNLRSIDLSWCTGSRHVPSFIMRM